MPWFNGDYPPSYKNLPKPFREENMTEGEAIAIGGKNARSFVEKKGSEKESKTTQGQRRKDHS